jgi:ADP-heptose:LPS heptosyltransferase
VTAAADARGGHVLVARLDSLGDVLLAGGAVRAVAASASRVTMLVAPGQEATAALLPGVDEVIAFDAAWVPLDPRPVDRRATRRLIRTLRRRRVEAALILTSFHQSPLPLALLLRLAGLDWVGATSADYPGSLLDLRHRVPDDLPEAERNLSLATAAGFRADADGARLAVRRPLPARPAWLPDRYVVLHPGSAVPARRPSASTSRGFATALTAAGWPVVVTGSAAERGLTAEVAGDTALDAGGRSGLAELAAVLDGAAAVVAPNTGPAHLAAAVGTPVVSLYAPVVPFDSWQPYGVPVVRLGDQQAACRSTRSRRCPVAGHPCLDGIAPAAVVAAVGTLAGAPRRRAASSPADSAGPPDAGPPDAGPSDAGPSDAGPWIPTTLSAPPPPAGLPGGLTTGGRQ